MICTYWIPIPKYDVKTLWQKNSRSRGNFSKGEDKLSRLISHLLALGKNDEIASATQNAVLRNQLYEKYSIN